jgi:hypothetical protein
MAVLLEAVVMILAVFVFGVALNRWVFKQRQNIAVQLGAATFGVLIYLIFRAVWRAF